MTDRGRMIVRACAILLGAGETLALVWFDAILLTGDDSWGIGRAVAAIVSIPYLLLVVPGTFLAIRNRWLPLALLLNLLAMPLAFLAWYMA